MDKWEAIRDHNFDHLRVIRTDKGEIVATVSEPYAEAIRALPEISQELRDVSQELLTRLQAGGLNRTDPELLERFEALVKRTGSLTGSRRTEK